jgi:hypothetical protein
MHLDDRDERLFDTVEPGFSECALLAARASYFWHLSECFAACRESILTGSRLTGRLSSVI